MNGKISNELEGIISQMLKPLKGLSLGIVIEGLSGFKAIPFDRTNEQDIEVLNKLKEIAEIVLNTVNENGILRPRPNEVGNDIEPFVKNALNIVNYYADTPKTANGKKKSTGYPDIEFKDTFGRINYLECKTYNIENINTTQRSFYLSPSEDFKIIEDAHHFGISFEIFVKKVLKISIYIMLKVGKF